MQAYYQDNAGAIYYGDCLEILPQMPKVGLILTDPPYGVNLEYSSYDDTEANWFDLVGRAIPLMRATAKMVIMPCCNIGRLGWYYQNFPPDWIVCWHKGSPGTHAFLGFNDWEAHVVYGKNNPKSMHDHFTVPNNEKMGNYGHPCPKPLGWARWFIDRASSPGDTVLDPFLGSGTTAVVAKEMGRQYIGIELSKEYCEIAATRLRKCTPSLFAPPKDRQAMLW